NWSHSSPIGIPIVNERYWNCQRELLQKLCCAPLVCHANGSTIGHSGTNVDMDSSPENVKALIGLAEEMLKQKNVESVLFEGKKIAEQSNYEKLDWFASELVEEHQKRCCRIAPTVAFKQAACSDPNKR
ncbi:hypothetical protein SAY86_019180, partial [Trapa natans]